MKPSPGPWTVEKRKIGSREPETYYVILDANGKVIMDTCSSEVALIMSEFDDGAVREWDEQGRVDCELIVELWKLFELLTKGEV